MLTMPKVFGGLRAKAHPAYEFHDNDDPTALNVVPFPTSIDDLGKEERQLTSWIVESETDIARLQADVDRLKERRTGTRQRIHEWARNHGAFENEPNT